MRLVCLFFIKGAEMIENLIVGLVSLVLVLYLFVVLVRPDRF